MDNDERLALELSLLEDGDIDQLSAQSAAYLQTLIDEALSTPLGDLDWEAQLDAI